MVFSQKQISAKQRAIQDIHASSPSPPSPQAVQPTTGNMLYDEVTDDCASFSELETRFSHVQPAELLYPADVSRALDGTLSEWATHK